MSKNPVVIVGGGLAGLAAAVRLHQAGVPFRLCEAAPTLGGRTITETLDGFLLDRGFQVLLTSYPAARELLDFKQLQLRYFQPGALIRYRGKFHRFVDPWRSPRHLLATAFAPVGTLGDKLRVARLRADTSRGTCDQLFERPETSTFDALRQRGFTDAILERFFRPFLGGVFLERELATSSRKFEFVFRMFAEGDAALPATGMGAMAEQLGKRLPENQVELGTRVESLTRAHVRLSTGEQIAAAAVVLATEAPTAQHLLDRPAGDAPHSVTCVYFAADRPPVQDPILVLNGDGEGPINNLCVPSQVAPEYAPANRSLVSVTVLGLPDDEIESSVRSQLQNWFGSEARDWSHLKTYRIRYALPPQAPPVLDPVIKPVEDDSGVFLCGDYLETASIQGALNSGRRAADAVLAKRAE